MEEKKQATEYAPIVFMNMPISDDKDDVIGINSTVATVKYAADNGATMVGVIADYGLENRVSPKH